MSKAPKHHWANPVPLRKKAITRRTIGISTVMCLTLAFMNYEMFSSPRPAGWEPIIAFFAFAGAVVGFLMLMLDDQKIALSEHGLRDVDATGLLYFMLRVTFSVTAGVFASYVATQLLPEPAKTNSIVLAGIAFAAAYARDLTSHITK